MKKFLSIALLFCVFTLSGCISVVDGVPQDEYDELLAKYEEVVAQRDALMRGETIDISEETEKKPAGKFDEKTVLSQLEVTEYSFSTDFWNYSVLVIKNNSEFDLSISASTKYYNSAGALVGAKENEESPVASGSEVCLYFMPDEKYAKMEYELSVEEEEWFESVVHELSYESSPAKNKEIVSVKNNGKEAAEFVEVYALFFNGDKPVALSSSYFTDDDSELKPGNTITKELDCYEDYTSVRFFLTGRRDK